MRDLTNVSLDSRKCGQCGSLYNVRQGKGGGLAYAGDLERFPFDEETGTGVRASNPHWFHGAHCSQACYDEAYFEPAGA